MTNEERREAAKMIREAGTGFPSVWLRMRDILHMPKDYTLPQIRDRLANIIEPDPERTCEIDRRDPSNPFCKECSYDWNDDWTYCPNCGCKAAG